MADPQWCLLNAWTIREGKTTLAHSIGLILELICFLKVSLSFAAQSPGGASQEQEALRPVYQVHILGNLKMTEAQTIPSQVGNRTPL